MNLEKYPNLLFFKFTETVFTIYNNTSQRPSVFHVSSNFLINYSDQALANHHRHSSQIPSIHQRIFSLKFQLSPCEPFHARARSRFPHQLCGERRRRKRRVAQQRRRQSNFRSTTATTTGGTSS